jgi:NAD(P)-dependent dehydrogenase (short-subunit alcohol dehydrogenase family)
MPRLDHRVALITGATSGIGESIARTFASEGARVIICGRREDKGSALAAEIRSTGGAATFRRCDVSDEADVSALMAEIERDFGGLDIVVNNAGTAPAGLLEDMTMDTWTTVIANNVTSVFLVTKHAIPLLRRSEHASVINLGSTFGVVGAGGSVAYAMTKAAAISMTKSLAIELAPSGIRVNALCPGATATPFLFDWAEETGNKDGTIQWLVDHHPIGRLSEPREQATVALFLASDDSSFVTGHALLVDGGYTAQ